MHIAYLTPEYPHEKTKHAGGMGTSIKNLVMALVYQNIRVSVVVYGQDVDEVYEDKGVSFHKIQQRQYPIGGFYLYRKHIEQYINTQLQDIDLIEAPDWTGITAFMRLKKPLVIRFHGSDTYFCHIEKRPQKWKNRFFETIAVKKATAFIAPTHYAGDVSMKLLGQPMSKLSVIHYGLALDRFNNDQPEVFEPYSILNVGTIIRKKGVFQLVQMFNSLVERYPQATLTFIGGDSNDIQTGSTSTWELVKKTCSQQAIERIKYLGKIPYDHVQEHIKKAHVCVFPSLAETLGMVTIESMALHKAVVNTDIGWAQDLITHEKDGFMHHPDDINAYVTSISKLFDDKELVTKIGKQARKRIVQQFDIHKIAQTNIAFYESICNS